MGGGGTSLRDGGRTAGPRLLPVWGPFSPVQPGPGPRSACTAWPDVSCPGPLGQPCPEISLRPGRAGESGETCSGPGPYERDPHPAPGGGAELGALRSGAPRRSPEHSRAQRGRLLSRMAFQSSAHECSLRPGGCSCTCRL